MASRIICLTFAKTLRNIQIHRNVLVHRKSLWPLKPHTSLLHFKTYDKDLRLNEDPQVNVSPRKTENLKEDPQIDVPPRRTESLKPEFLSTDPDVFGDAVIDDTPPDPGDVQEDEYIQNPTRRTKKADIKKYAKEIKEHLNNKRLKEAIDVLEVKMLKEDRAKPNSYIYNLLISGCAKAGYTKKAFQLFNKMKQRNLKVKASTYTSLFNACANAPSIADGLAKANHLREIMLEKGVEANEVNYNAMIKAYGRLGDTKTAYMLADEMLDKKLKVNTDTFNFLLQACASDKRYGFRHALLTWHRMHKNGIAPDYYSFNLMLRCVRDASIGDVETMEGVLRHIFDGSKDIPTLGSYERLQITAEFADNTNSREHLEEKIQVNPFNDKKTELTRSSNSIEKRVTELAHPEFETPNLLTSRPHLGSLVALEEVKNPHDRLLLIGGFSGILLEMKKYGITPGIETFTTLLEVIPPTYAAEKQLIQMIRKIGLKSDIDFFNILIKKRSMRFDYEGAKEVLSMIKTAGLYPDIVTYGVLALGCQTQEAARELIAEMKSKDIRMNAQILGAMLRQGCAQKAFGYVSEILQISLDENVPPNDVFFRHLDNFYKQCAQLLDIRHSMTRNKNFKRDHAKFCKKYRTWQEEHGIEGLKLEDAIKKLKQRPYQHFKEDSIDGVEDVKNVKLSKRSKMRKYIKKIKVHNLRGDPIDQSADVKRIEPA
ncbi:pentatricopeptide repeat-containing protein 1, mitochondrial [Eupeodes corollae]|uniref:pentatricopeptide repeat-containing protein 1, mitochondrial n=1 Tax=Eupeodes corollae TaxID=290404 RepID=UPI0024904FB9|nr:pentatricopeptide repeat-containing protein 1, mitochondrial [Eupeodes corollae]